MSPDCKSCRTAERRRLKDLGAFSVTERDSLIYHSQRGETLGQVLIEELRDWQRDDTHHRAVWQGERIVAIVRPGPDGAPEVIRIDP